MKSSLRSTSLQPIQSLHCFLPWPLNTQEAPGVPLESSAIKSSMLFLILVHIVVTLIMTQIISKYKSGLAVLSPATGINVTGINVNYHGTQLSIAHDWCYISVLQNNWYPHVWVKLDTIFKDWGNVFWQFVPCVSIYNWTTLWSYYYIVLVCTAKQHNSVTFCPTSSQKVQDSRN